MLLSIVTASYKRVKLLKKNYKFLRSRVKDFDFEWVIVYEKSDLKTKQFLKTLRDKFIKIKESNSKSADTAYNLGFNIARGKYVNIHGDDDYFDEKNFKSLKDILKSEKAWIVAQAEYVDNNFRKIRIFTSIIKKTLLKNYNSNILTFINFLMTPSIFFKKNKIKSVGGYDDRIKFGTDYIFWLKFARHYKPQIINQVFSYIRYDNTTKTGTPSPKLI